MNPRLRAMGVLAALASITNPEELGYGAVKERLRKLAVRDPVDTMLATVVIGSYLFFAAEKEHNPKVNSLGDAFVFISTCMSVGYSDIFAKTEAGKAIATAVMTFGPAMATRALDPPQRDDAVAAPRRTGT